jgi:c-di-GMP-binding flagellar brake protein YcgR
MADPPPESSDERREASRHSLRAAVVCRRLGGADAADEAHGETTDLSLGGFGARLDGRYAPGDVVDADLVLDAHLVTVRALVVNVTVDDDHQLVHCAFSEPPPPVRRVIQAFVAARS